MLKSFYFNKIVYYIAGLASAVFVLSYFYPAMFRVATMLLLLLCVAVVIDSLLLYTIPNGVVSRRIGSERFSIADEKPVRIELKDGYAFPVRVSMIDELPAQFQQRNWIRKLWITSGNASVIDYALK